MEITTSADPQSLLESKARSRSFLSSSILLGCVIGMCAIELLTEFTHLPMGAALNLAAVVAILVAYWRGEANRHTSLTILLSLRRDLWTEKSLENALIAEAKAIERGVYLTSIAVMAFLWSISAVLRGH